MNFKSTLIAALLLAGLGSWYYFYEVKGKPERDKIKEDGKRVFKGLERASIQQLSLHQASGDVELKDAGGTWQMTKPLISPVDQVVFDGMLDAFYMMKQEEMIDETGAKPADFGLAQPAGSVTYVGASGSTKTINFGIDNPTGQYAYAQVKGEAPIFLVMKYVKTNVMKEAKDLRDKKVWDFEPASVIKIRSSFGKGLALERGKDGTFALTSPLKSAGDQEAINNWLTQLKALRIETFVDGGAKNAGKFELGANSKRISIDLGPKSAPLVLIQGRTMDTNKTHYYMLQGGSLVFSMSESAATTLEKKAEDLAKKPDPTPVPTATVTPAAK